MIEVLHRLCRVCDACIAVCPTLALRMHADRLVWDPALCRDERACVVVCPARALRVVEDDLAPLTAGGAASAATDPAHA